ncbi:MAG: autotransporter domain-containing protein [Verrucomicrobia bacterium]|nr:autotransporter domain-containing protein [Verrucomicrobiota bacterium]
MYAKKILSSLILFTSAFAADATNDTTLNSDIISANAGGDSTINFLNNITLTPTIAPLLRPLSTDNTFTPVNRAFVINGNNFTLSGANSFRLFFVRGGTATINDLTFSGGKAQGGAGGTTGQTGGAGGGGAGLGGALFVSAGTSVTLNNVSFTSCNASGGAGGSHVQLNQGGGGGGGMLGSSTQIIGNTGGNGGGGFGFSGGSGILGGGGGGGTGSLGSDAPINDGGNGGTNFGGGAGGTGGLAAGPVNGSPGASGTGGGGGASPLGANGGNGAAGGAGGGGGGGGSAPGGGSFTGGNGGNGGYAGGGGGGGLGDGANGGTGGLGGFGAGGGGGAFCLADVNPGGSGGSGGTGGFGGGGGGGGGVDAGPGTAGPGASGGFGGGNGGPGTLAGGGSTGGGGGGGAGFGGAIFIEAGGALTINGRASFENNSVTAGGAGDNRATGGHAAGADIFMMGGATLSFDIISDVTIPNPIAGDTVVGGGGLTKNGPAILHLNGANTYTGTTTVNAGTLNINGSILTSITNNATVTGTFSTPGTLTNNGIVSPGIITVGSFVNNPGATLLINIHPVASPPNNSLIAGSATLAGDLQVFLNSGNYVQGTVFTLLSGPTAGTFNFIPTGPAAPFVNLGITYGDGVFLTVLQHSFFNHQRLDPGIPTTIANCINNANITIPSDFASLILALGELSNAALNQALYSMSPVNYGTFDWINARNNSLIARILSERVLELRCEPCETFNFWVDFYGALMHNKQQSNNLARYRSDAAGAIGGLDVSLWELFNIGVAGGYTYNWIHWKNHLGNGNNHTYYGAVYSSLRTCNIDLDFSAIGGKSDYQFTRNVSFTTTGNPASTPPTPPVTIERKARSHPDAYFATGHLGLGWKWHWCSKIFEPFVLADYHYYHRQSFTEHGGGGINLSVQKDNQHMLRGEAGFKLYHIWENCSYFSAPYIALSWVGEYPLGNIHQRASFAFQTCVIDTISSHSNIQFLSPELGMKWTTNCGRSFSLFYKGYFNHKTIINEGDIRFDFAF